MSVQRKLFLTEIQLTIEVDYKESMAIMVHMSKPRVQRSRNIIAFTVT